MEFAKTELIAIEEFINKAAGALTFKTLTDLQLALVGGGVGDVVFI